MEFNTENTRLELSPESLSYLSTTRKWTMFFAIMGFIMVGMVIIAALGTGVFLSIFNSGSGQMGNDFPGWLIAPILIMVALLYFYPALFLYRFSKHMRNAVNNKNSQELPPAFRNLKSYFAYIGVLLILVLAIYFVAILVMGVSSILNSVG